MIHLNDAEVKKYIYTLNTFSKDTKILIQNKNYKKFKFENFLFVISCKFQRLSNSYSLSKNI